MKNWSPPLTDEQLNEIVTKAQLPRVLTDPRIQTPTLVIMLGSTPAKAGLELERQMLTLSARDRRRVALVFIDTDDIPSEVRSFRKAHEGMFQESTLRISVPAGINFATLPREDQHTYIPSKVPQYFANGAGGIRNNGHVAVAFDHQNIVQTLQTALLSIEKLEPAQGEERVREIQVNIVAFLGGGTGSGILGDLAVIVRQMLVARQYQQRINLFCMLPEYINGVSTTDVSWRKSNSTACLLELLAISLAAGANSARRNAANGHNGTHASVYEKFLLNQRYYVTDDPIANEVYLIGRTAMKTAEDSARIVGLDLFQRITDASGIGFLEHSTWVNRRVLGATDDRLLPTMFGTSCPLEVLFPAQATARAFAQISAAYLLPALKSAQEPTRQPFSVTDKHEVIQKWRAVAQLTENTNGKPLAVKRPVTFRPENFDGAAEDTFPVRRRELERRVQGVQEAIAQRVAAQRRAEEQRIYGAAPQEPQDTNDAGGIGVLGRQLAYVLRLQQEYEGVKNELAFNPPEPPSSVPLDDAEQDYLRRPWWMPGTILDSRTQDKIAVLADEYNVVMEAQAVATRHGLLSQAVEDLLKLAAQRIAELRSWYLTTDLEEQRRRLETTGRSSAAWHGLMDDQHPHLRHIYDVATLRAAQGDHCPAVERLYNAVTFGIGGASNRGEANGHGGTPDEFAKRIEHRFLDQFLAFLNSQHVEDQTASTASLAAQQAAGGVDAEGKNRLPERVVEFFTQHYLVQFQELNLFDLLEIGAGTKRPPLSSQILEHLLALRGLMEGLVAFESNLWNGGGERLDRTLYLGMRWEEDKSYQKAALDRAIVELGPMTSASLSPSVANMIDPHRLQISYGQHGISLATIPEFYLDNNSSMECYLWHQADWFGNDGPIPTMPAPQAYGVNKMPVHSSGEMEELVCDVDALSYPADKPHAPTYGTNLRGRVIREPSQLNTKPNWGARRPGTGPVGDNPASAQHDPSQAYRPWSARGGPFDE